MPSQIFRINTAKGYAGDLVDSGPRVVQSGLVEAPAINFGVAVKRGTVALDPKFVLPGIDASGIVFALSQREWNHEALNRPSDGTTYYMENESISLMRQGYLYLEVTDRAAVAGDLVNFDDSTGKATGGVAGAGETASINVTWEESALVGEVAKARIDIVAVAAAVAP